MSKGHLKQPSPRGRLTLFRRPFHRRPPSGGPSSRRWPPRRAFRPRSTSKRSRSKGDRRDHTDLDRRVNESDSIRVFGESYPSNQLRGLIFAWGMVRRGVQRPYRGILRGIAIVVPAGGEPDPIPRQHHLIEGGAQPFAQVARVSFHGVPALFFSRASIPDTHDLAERPQLPAVRRELERSSCAFYLTVCDENAALPAGPVPQPNLTCLSARLPFHRSEEFALRRECRLRVGGKSADGRDLLRQSRRVSEDQPAGPIHERQLPVRSECNPTGKIREAGKQLPRR